MSILILSDNDDAHLQFVTRHLQDKPIIVGSKAIIEGEELSYYPDEDVILFNNEVLTPKSIWYRKPYWALRQLPVDARFKDYSYQALKWHISSLTMYFKDAFWISDPQAVMNAEYKSTQLAVAKQLGFVVPKTIITSNPHKAKSFINEHDTIIKSHSSVYPVDKENKEGLALWATRVIKGEDVPLRGLHLAPAIFQEAVDALFDIRVTVVGDQVFATSMASKNVADEFSSIRDCRIGVHSGDIVLEPFQLPKTIEIQCMSLVKKLGLVFGALDLVQDKRGRYWFLEINPNGQWAFVEQRTEQPIGAAIAALLTRLH